MKVLAPALRVEPMFPDLMPPSTAISKRLSEWTDRIIESASLIFGSVSGRKS